MKIEYELVTYVAYDLDEAGNFIELVNEKLAQDWTLQGGITCCLMPDCKECVFFAQAVIREIK